MPPIDLPVLIQKGVVNFFKPPKQKPGFHFSSPVLSLLCSPLSLLSLQDVQSFHALALPQFHLGSHCHCQVLGKVHSWFREPQ